MWFIYSDASVCFWASVAPHILTGSFCRCSRSVLCDDEPGGAADGVPSHHCPTHTHLHRVSILHIRPSPSVRKLLGSFPCVWPVSPSPPFHPHVLQPHPQYLCPRLEPFVLPQCVERDESKRVECCSLKASEHHSVLLTCRSQRPW